MRNKLRSARRILKDKKTMDDHKFETYDNDRKHVVRDAITDKYEKPYDIAIAGLWYGKNYGSVLTYYALYKLCEQMGYNPVLIDRPPYMWNDTFDDPDEMAQRFVRPRCNVGGKWENKTDTVILNKLAKTFIIGSDVVWNYEICGRGAGHFFFLDFVDGINKKIAFASSIGSGMKGAPEDYLRIASAFLRDFDYISVREENAKKTLKEDFDVEVDHVMDPVFLVHKDTYEEIADSVEPLSDEPYVMSYILGATPDKAEALETIKDTLGIQSVSIKNPNEPRDLYDEYGIELTDRTDLEDWMRCIRNCDLFYGDSFHGLCFSIIFERPFIIQVTPDIAGLTRFQSLLADCGLSERLIFTDDENAEKKIRELAEKPIDWKNVNARLEALKLDSEAWLYKAITGKKLSFWQKHALKQAIKEREAAVAESDMVADSASNTQTIELER